MLQQVSSTLHRDSLSFEPLLFLDFHPWQAHPTILTVLGGFGMLISVIVNERMMWNVATNWPSIDTRPCYRMASSLKVQAITSKLTCSRMANSIFAMTG